MRLLALSAVGLVALWLQLSLAPLIAVAGFKPNLILVFMLVIGLRRAGPWLFIYATLSGLAHDVFSHGLLGVYAVSFFLVFFAARYAGMSVFEKNLIFAVTGVFILTLMEGLISVSVFEYLDPSVPWWEWMLGKVAPGAVFNCLLTPPVWFLLSRLEWALYPPED